MGTETQTLPITQIHRPADLQLREVWDTDHVNELAEALQNGAELPPVKVVREGQTYWLWDGHHTVAAHGTAGISKVNAEVTKDGDRNTARWLACSANSDHGLKRSDKTKWQQVAKALELAPKWSNRKVAEHCRVSDPLVAKVRESTANISSEREGKDGRTQNTQTPARKKAAKKKTEKSGSVTPADTSESASQSSQDDSGGGESGSEETGQPKKTGKPKSGSEVFGPKKRSDAKDKLSQFIRLAADAPDYEKRVRPHADKLMEWAKGE